MLGNARGVGGKVACDENDGGGRTLGAVEAVIIILACLVWLAPGLVLPAITAFFRAIGVRTWPVLELVGMAISAVIPHVFALVLLSGTVINPMLAEPVLPDQQYRTMAPTTMVPAEMLALGLTVQGLWATFLNAVIRQPRDKDQDPRQLHFVPAAIFAALTVVGSAMLLLWSTEGHLNYGAHLAVGAMLAIAMPLAFFTGLRAPESRILPALLGLPAAAWSIGLVSYSPLGAAAAGLGFLVLALVLTAWPGGRHPHLWAWTLAIALCLAPSALLGAQGHAMVQRTWDASLAQTRLHALERQLGAPLPACGESRVPHRETVSAQAFLVRRDDFWVNRSIRKDTHAANSAIDQLTIARPRMVDDEPHEDRPIAEQPPRQDAVLVAAAPNRTWSEVVPLIHRAGAVPGTIGLACADGDLLRAVPTVSVHSQNAGSGAAWTARIEDGRIRLTVPGQAPCLVDSLAAVQACVPAGGAYGAYPDVLVSVVGDPPFNTVVRWVGVLSDPVPGVQTRIILQEQQGPLPRQP